MSSDSPRDRYQQLWQEQERQRVDFPLGDIPQRAARFQRVIRRRNGREYVAAVLVVAAFAGFAATTDSVLVRVACAATIAAALYVTYHLRRYGRAAPVAPIELAAATADHLASHRSELERQRDLLATVWRWYLGPMVPGFLLLVASIPIEHRVGKGLFRVLRAVAPEWSDRSLLWMIALIVLAFGALAFLGIAKLNRMAARKLQREIDALLPQTVEEARSR